MMMMTTMMTMVAMGMSMTMTTMMLLVAVIVMMIAWALPEEHAAKTMSGSTSSSIPLTGACFEEAPGRTYGVVYCPRQWNACVVLLLPTICMLSHRGERGLNVPRHGWACR